jgi:signal transduction histidine kinase
VGRSEVGGVLDRIAEGWAPVLAERHLALDVRHPPAPMMAGVDGEVVERIVAPLIDNALRYARSHVVLGATVREGAIVVSIADDGPGVEPEAREHLFEPGRAAGVNGHGGAGLGLPLARRLALAAGGDVTFAPPRDGAGAEFQVRLPG